MKVIAPVLSLLALASAQSFSTSTVTYYTTCTVKQVIGTSTVYTGLVTSVATGTVVPVAAAYATGASTSSIPYPTGASNGTVSGASQPSSSSSTFANPAPYTGAASRMSGAQAVMAAAAFGAVALLGL